MCRSTSKSFLNIKTKRKDITVNNQMKGKPRNVYVALGQVEGSCGELSGEKPVSDLVPRECPPGAPGSPPLCFSIYCSRSLTSFPLAHRSGSSVDFVSFCPPFLRAQEEWPLSRLCSCRALGQHLFFHVTALSPLADGGGLKDSTILGAPPHLPGDRAPHRDTGKG